MRPHTTTIVRHLSLIPSTTMQKTLRGLQIRVKIRIQNIPLKSFYYCRSNSFDLNYPRLEKQCIIEI
jgi:hypothetical protein